MPKIIQLEQHVADLIAAGEVVSRPASVVKELIENSIDAGAGIITAEIASGGMTYIRITDNGCGIASDEVKTAFLRHATSKLQDAKGLERIETLGFRGEALAAIAAVSNVEITTRTSDAVEGTRLRLKAGEPLDLSPVGAPVGTTIIVRDLFFNTPARLKFMKTDRAEGSAVSSVVLRCALSRPDISFRYIKDGKTEYHTPGDSRVESCIYSLLGREAEAGFIPVALADEYVSVKGFVSAPSAARGNRSGQYFFINGRSIRSLLLQAALEQAYKNSLTSGRFPACVLYLTVGTNCVDVNVHPAKTEVRFVSDKQVFDGVYYAVLGALEKGGGVSAVAQCVDGLDVGAPCGRPRAGTQARPYENAASAYNVGAISDRPRANDVRPYSETIGELQHSYIREAPPYRMVGEVFDTYIILERGDVVCFIDKHAAHERIHYNALTSGKYEPMSEALISPIICRFSCSEAQALLDNADFLESLGFTVESFGEDAIAVRHIPSDIRQSDVEPALSEICEHLELGGSGSSDCIDKTYKTMACKAAIKAGSSSDMLELEALASRVISGEISHCPHGRPIVFEISKEMLEKGFKRI